MSFKKVKNLKNMIYNNKNFFVNVVWFWLEIIKKKTLKDFEIMSVIL